MVINYVISLFVANRSSLGRKQEALQEAKRAVEILPVSKDALDGPTLVDNLATVYGWTNEADLAFQALVSCPRNNRYIVAIKMGRRQGARREHI
jgi:hypothetical protein